MESVKYYIPEGFSVKEEMISPQKAEEYLKFNTENRILNEASVDYLVEEIRKGQWRLTAQGISFLKNGRLGDGQHRLAAIRKSGIAIPLVVARGVDNDSFSIFDSGRNRRLSDIFSIENIPNNVPISALVNRFLQIRDTDINIISRGCSLIARKGKHTKMDILNEYKSDPDFYQGVVSLSIGWKNKAKLLSASEVGAIYAYLIKIKNHPRGIVTQFFNELFAGVNFSNNTIYLLREKLMQDNYAKRKMTAKEKEQLLIKTWNCFITHKELKRLTWNEETEGILKFI